MHIASDSQNIYLTTDAQEAWYVKQLTGAKYTDDDGNMFTFEVPNTYGSGTQMAYLFPEYGKYGRPEPTPVVDSRLSPLQQYGVGWLCRDDGLLADEMGVGKTVEVCSALHRLYTYTREALIVTTASTIYAWADHLAEWAPSYKVFVLVGTVKEREKILEEYKRCIHRKVLLTTHGLVLKHSAWIHFGKHKKGQAKDPFLSDNSWDVMVVDEMHKFRDAKGKTFRALCAIRKKVATCWLLTGTPVEDSPDDMWQYLRLIDPRTFEHRSRFRDRYCDMVPLKWGGLENRGIRPEMRAEYDEIVDYYMLRRFRRQVWPELPESLPTEYRMLDMTPQQAKAYKQMAKEQMATIEEDLLIALDPLSMYQKLDYIASGIPNLDEEGNVKGISTPSNKLNAILDIAEERNGDPFVVYAPSRKVVDMLYWGLSDAGYSVGRITGEVSSKERDAYVKLFQDGKLDVMVMTSAGAEGITLTAADLLVYCDLDWSLRVNQQVGDRIDRKGQGRPPQKIVLMSRNTIDVSRRWAVRLKEQKQQELLKDPDIWKEIVHGNFTHGEQGEVA